MSDTLKKVIVLLLYSFLTLIFTYPLILHLDSAIYGHEIVGFNYDPFGYMNKLQSVKDYFLAYKRPLIHPYIHPMLDYPGAFLAYISDEVIAYNILLILSFPLAGFFAYILANYLTRNKTASFFAGLLYAFSPYHWIHSYYHLSLSQIQWFPLYLFSLILFSDAGRLRHGLLLLISLLLVTLSNFYYALLAVVLTFLFLIYQGLYISFSKKKERETRLRPFLLLSGSIFFGGIILFSILQKNLISIFKNLPSFSVRYDDLFRYGSRPWGFVLPPIDNPFLGWLGKDYIMSRLEGGTLVEHTLYLGLVPVILTIIATWGWLKKKGRFDERANFYIPFLFILIFISLLFSRPPVMTLFGVALHMPSHYIYQFLPMFRAYARFGLLVYLAIAVLAAGGLSLLIKEKRKVMVASLAFLFLFLEYTNMPPFRSNPILPTEAHQWLSRNVRNALIADYTQEGRSGIPTVRRLLRNKLVPAPYFEAYNLFDFSDRRLLGIIKTIGVRYVILPKDMGDFVKVNRQQNYREFKDSFLLEVNADPLPLTIRFQKGFYSHTRRGKEYFRWMGDTGVMIVTNHTPKEVDADLSLVLQSFFIPRKITIEIGQVEGRHSDADSNIIALDSDVKISNPRKWDKKVDTDVGKITLKNVLFKPGRTALRITPYPGAQKVDEVLHDGDQREVSIAVKAYDYIQNAEKD